MMKRKVQERKLLNGTVVEVWQPMAVIPDRSVPSQAFTMAGACGTRRSMTNDTSERLKERAGELSDDASDLQEAIFSLRITRPLGEFRNGLDDCIGWAEVLAENLVKLRDAAKEVA